MKRTYTYSGDQRRLDLLVYTLRPSHAWLGRHDGVVCPWMSNLLRPVLTCPRHTYRAVAAAEPVWRFQAAELSSRLADSESSPWPVRSVAGLLPPASCAPEHDDDGLSRVCASPRVPDFARQLTTKTPSRRPIRSTTKIADEPRRNPCFHVDNFAYVNACLVGYAVCCRLLRICAEHGPSWCRQTEKESVYSFYPSHHINAKRIYTIFRHSRINQHEVCHCASATDVTFKQWFQCL